MVSARANPPQTFESETWIAQKGLVSKRPPHRSHQNNRRWQVQQVGFVPFSDARCFNEFISPTIRAFRICTCICIYDVCSFRYKQHHRYISGDFGRQRIHIGNPIKYPINGKQKHHKSDNLHNWRIFPRNRYNSDSTFTWRVTLGQLFGVVRSDDCFVSHIVIFSWI